PISTATSDQSSVAIAFDGTNYLVVWQDYRNGDLDIYGARVSQTGAVLDPNGISISTATSYQSSPSIAFDGTNYLVVWQDFRSGSSDIYGARVSPAGIILDTNGITISTAPNDQEYPAVAFDGTNYLVGWEDRRRGDYSDIYGARISQAGTILDPEGLAVSIAFENQMLPTIAFGNENYLVVWGDYRSDNHIDVYGSRISPGGAVLDPNGIIISTAIYEQWDPAVAFDGTNYLVVWEDNRNGDWDIYGARVNPTGVILDPDCIPISHVSYSDEWSPSVAFDGTNYLVVWEDDRDGEGDIYGARVSQTGVVLDPEGIPISTAYYDQWYPSIIFGGVNYFVAWEDYRNGSDWNIYGARVSQAGVVLDPEGISISTPFRDQEYPAVAFDGTSYLVVWQDQRNSYSPDIYGARVSQSGSVLDPDGIPVAVANRNQRSPTLTFAGTNYLVVWYDNRDNRDYANIYGARLTPAGVVLDSNGIPIATLPNVDKEYPVVAFDGTNYLILWEDYRNNSDTADIYGAKLSPSGVVVDSFPVSLQFGNQYSPALARGFGNQILIIYTGWTGEYQGRTYNAMRIWGKFYPFAGVEEERIDASLTPNTFLVYPNPANSYFTIYLPKMGKGDWEIKIYDVLGNLVSVFQAKNSRCFIPIANSFKEGIYFLKVGKETKKLIIKR
ncbi:MAG: T9SS type A sorting domain-containing protein, partial [candidate division WOR-3 bacterium]